MLGAIIGDIVGSRFEFKPTNDYDFEFFTEECSFTDDTVCTVAIADAILRGRDYGESLHEWCRRYPNPKGGYGESFREWVSSDDPKPYNSFGNGSAMRVSPVAWSFLNLGAVIPQARRTAVCTHNHPEGIRGAEAVAMAIHYGDEIRRLADKIDRETILEAFRPILAYTGYDINIRRANVLNRFDETCQGTVPVALWIITESTGFEDAVRKAVSLGADADTLGAIVGSIAEAIWGIPADLALKAMHYLPTEMKRVIREFHAEICHTDTWYTGIKGKICEGCIYAEGISRGSDRFSEIRGCGRCCRNTFMSNYQAGQCKFRKTELFKPSQFEAERIEAALRKKAEDEARRKQLQKNYEDATQHDILLKKTYVAGTQFVSDETAFCFLESYSKVQLVRECDNAYDPYAVSLYFQGKHIGYLPRTENREIAAMLEANMYQFLSVFVTDLSRVGDTRKINISIFIKPYNP